MRLFGQHCTMAMQSLGVASACRTCLRECGISHLDSLLGSLLNYGCNDVEWQPLLCQNLCRIGIHSIGKVAGKDPREVYHCAACAIGRQDLLRESVCRLVYHSQCVVGSTFDKDVTLGEIDFATYRKCLERVEHRAVQMRSKRLHRATSCSVCDNRTLCHLQLLGNICYCIVTHRDKVEIGLCQAGVTPLALCQLGNLAATLLVAGKELHKLQTFGLCHSLSQRLRHISTTYNYNLHIEFIFIAKNFSPMRVKHHLSAPPSEQR